MELREQLKAEIDHVDIQYLDLLSKIVRQFSHEIEIKQSQSEKPKQTAGEILQEIADRGGLGVSDPQAWQREIREDRPLPFRE